MALSPVLVPLTLAVADAVSVAPSTIVRVEPVAGAVTVTLFMLVALRTLTPLNLITLPLARSMFSEDVQAVVAAT